MIRRLNNSMKKLMKFLKEEKEVRKKKSENKHFL